jgi:hypothetical protein
MINMICERIWSYRLQVALTTVVKFACRGRDLVVSPDSFLRNQAMPEQCSRKMPADMSVTRGLCPPRITIPGSQSRYALVAFARQQLWIKSAV